MTKSPVANCNPWMYAVPKMKKKKCNYFNNLK